ncbi:hypothetical protein PG991_008331 [Apiospora marii]|uniref:HEAT repeat domain-containing protein n=1 Tax=Apiospora marii TaxID=335849 RepID=A0ABR1RS45_9PEZI
MKEYYDEALLGTAAWLNDLGLLKESLQSIEGVPGPRERLLHYAVSAAAYKGHNEAAMLLLDAIQNPQVKSEAGQHLIHSAGKGNQLSTLELGLALDYVEAHERCLAKALCNSSSLPLYERLYPLAREVGTASQSYFLLSFATAAIPNWMRELAGLGVVPIMDRLLQRADLKLYPKKFPLCYSVLLAAVKSGNPAVVRLLLGHPDATWSLGFALVEAACREHEEVARMLLEVGSSRLSDKEMRDAIKAATSRGLGSMRDLVKDYDSRR